MNYDHVFIITYPHPGAGKLQGVLNGSGHADILDESAGAEFSLFRARCNFGDRISGLVANPHPRPEIPAWLAARTKDAQGISGFVETRIGADMPRLGHDLDFLRRNFPSSLLIFDHHTPAEPFSNIADFLKSYAREHPGCCAQTDYHAYGQDPQALRDLWQRIGLEGSPPLALAPDLIPGHVENGVIVGTKGWLFLWDGSNAVNRYFTDPDYFAATQTRDWVRLLQDRRDRLAQIGAKYRHVTVPDKLSVHADFLADPLPYPDRHPSRLIAAELPSDDLNVDILDDLKSLPRPGFYKTDTHWNFDGCNAAYLRLCRALDVTPREFSAPTGSGAPIMLDLGNKLSPPLLENARFVPVLKRARRVAENGMVRYNEAEGLAKGKPRFVGCHIQTRNDAADARPETVVLFGDSFSEFRPHLLTAMLAETFCNVHFVWSTSLDHEFIARIRPQIVISEIAERFMATLPTDDFRVSVE